MSVESSFAIALVLQATLFDWLKNLAPLLIINQSEVKPRPIVTYSHAFSRAWRWLHVFASSPDWSTELSASLVIGQSNYFGFGFTALNLELL